MKDNPAQDAYLARVNRAMTLPRELWADDGRRFRIVSWEPDLCTGKMITIKIGVIVEMDGEIQQCR
jgi:hypothetical protein